MRSLPPESERDDRPEESGRATDFASLTAGIAERATRRNEAPTDFRSLRRGAFDERRLIGRRTMTDWLVDGLTPLMIFVMVYSVIFFLLDVRIVYLEASAPNRDLYAHMHDNILRWVAFCFVVGVVSLNRLVVRDGKDESVLYIFGLGAAIALYTFATTQEIGSVASNFMNQPYLATLFNVSVVAFVWWVTNRLTHECCVDSNPSAGDIGILTGTARRLQKAVRSEPSAAPAAAKTQRDDASGPMYDLKAMDPSQWKKPQRKAARPAGPATKRLPKRHPGISIFYTSIPVMAIFAVGQRVLLNGDSLVARSGHLFIAAYAGAALSLLMLSSLGGLREYFRERRINIPAGIGPFWIGLGSVMLIAVLVAAAWMPLPSLPPMARIASVSPTAPTRDSDRSASDGDASEGGSGRDATPTDDSRAQRTAPDQDPGGTSPDASQEDGAGRDDGQAGSQEGDPDSGKADRRDGRDSRSTSRERRVTPPAMNLPEPSQLLEWLGRGVLIFVGVIGVFALIRLLGALALGLSRGSKGYSNVLRRFFGALDRFLQRITHLPSLPRIQRRRRVSREVSQSVHYANPIRNPRMTPAEKVEYSYAALCALAHDAATPRGDDQTPYEFIRSFPEPLATLRDDARELTDLYVLSAYSGRPMDESCLDRLRKFWHTFERVRGAVVR